jgi:hypothetical protein
MDILLDELLYLIFNTFYIKQICLINKRIKKIFDDKFKKLICCITTHTISNYIKNGTQTAVIYTDGIVNFYNTDITPVYLIIYNSSNCIDVYNFLGLDLHSKIQLLKLRQEYQIDIKKLVNNEIKGMTLYMYSKNIVNQKIFYNWLYMNIVCLNIQPIIYQQSNDINTYITMNKDLLKTLTDYINKIDFNI